MITKIQIPATLVTSRHIRCFLADGEAEARHQPFQGDYFYDVPLSKSALLSRHDEVIATLQEQRSEKASGCLDEFGTVIRTTFGHRQVVYAYQFVEVEVIVDSRKKFKHENQETQRTSKYMAKKVFIFGKKITRAKAKQLASAVKEMIPRGSIEKETILKVNGLSSYTPMGVSKLPRRFKGTHVLKLGPATFFPFDPEKMELNPL